MFSESDLVSCHTCKTEFDTDSFRIVLESCGHITCGTCFCQSSLGCMQCIEENKRSETFNILVHNNLESAPGALGRDFGSAVENPRIFCAKNSKITSTSSIFADSSTDEDHRKSREKKTDATPVEVRQKSRNAENLSSVWKEKLCKPKETQESKRFQFSPSQISSTPPILQPISDFTDSEQSLASADTDDEDWRQARSKRKKKLNGLKLKKKNGKKSRFQNDLPPVLERMDISEHFEMERRCPYECFRAGQRHASSCKHNWETIPKKPKSKFEFPVVDNLAAVLGCVQTDITHRTGKKKRQTKVIRRRAKHKRKKSKCSRRKKQIRLTPSQPRVLKNTRTSSLPWQNAARKLPPCFVVLTRMKLAKHLALGTASPVFKQVQPSSASRGRKSFLDRIRNGCRDDASIDTNIYLLESQDTVNLEPIITTTISDGASGCEDSQPIQPFAVQSVVGGVSPTIFQHEGFEAPGMFVLKPITTTSENSSTVVENDYLVVPENIVFKSMSPLAENGSKTADDITKRGEMEENKNRNEPAALHSSPDVTINEDGLEAGYTVVRGPFGNYSTEVSQTVVESLQSFLKEKNKSGAECKDTASDITRQEQEMEQKLSKLTAQMKVFEDENKPHEYGVDLKKLDTKSHLTNQKVCKNLENPFKCKECGKGFVTKTRYDYHLRLHKGEKPYKCNQCPTWAMGYRTKGELNHHAKFHRQENSYACDICKLRFVTPEYLNKHMTMHTGDGPKIKCGNTYYWRDSLYQHMWEIHKQPKYIASELSKKAAPDYFANQSEKSSSNSPHEGKTSQHRQETCERVDTTRDLDTNLEEDFLITGDVLSPESADERLEQEGIQDVDARYSNVLQDSTVDSQEFNEDNCGFPVISRVYSINEDFSDNVSVTKDLVSDIIAETIPDNVDSLNYMANEGCKHAVTAQAKCFNAVTSCPDKRTEKRTRLYVKSRDGIQRNARGKETADVGTQCIPPKSVLTSTGYVVKIEVIDIDDDDDYETSVDTATRSIQVSPNPDRRIPNTIDCITASHLSSTSSLQYVTCAGHEEDTTRLITLDAQRFTSDANFSDIPTPPGVVGGVQHIHSLSYPTGRTNVVSDSLEEENHYTYRSASTVSHRTQHSSEPASNFHYESNECIVPQIYNTSRQYQTVQSPDNSSTVQCTSPLSESTRTTTSVHSSCESMQLYTSALIRIVEGPDAEKVRVLLTQKPTVPQHKLMAPTQAIYNRNGIEHRPVRWQPPVITPSVSVVPLAQLHNGNRIIFSHETLQYQQENILARPAAPIHLVQSLENTVAHQMVPFQQDVQMQETMSEATFQRTRSMESTAISKMPSKKCLTEEISQTRPEAHVQLIPSAYSQARSPAVGSQQDQVQAAVDLNTSVMPQYGSTTKVDNRTLPPSDVTLKSVKEVLLHHNYATKNTFSPATLQKYMRGSSREIRKDLSSD